ncbi:MAG: hypothetical protein KC416_11100 [Myxococcales bacterium]|nr:hypothetical protein [Myxococcales bacterium]
MNSVIIPKVTLLCLCFGLVSCSEFTRGDPDLRAVQPKSEHENPIVESKPADSEEYHLVAICVFDRDGNIVLEDELE